MPTLHSGAPASLTRRKLPASRVRWNDTEEPLVEVHQRVVDEHESVFDRSTHDVLPFLTEQHGADSISIRSSLANRMGPGLKLTGPEI